MSWNSTRPNREATMWGCQWWFWILAAVIVITITAGIVGYALDWFNTAKDVVSPQNVKEQWKFAYEYEEKLQAVAQQVCNAQEAYELAASDNERSQRLTYLQGYKNNYASMQADYDARLRNAFEAKLVKPADVPDRAPTLQENMQHVCPNIGQ